MVASEELEARLYQGLRSSSCIVCFLLIQRFVVNSSRRFSFSSAHVGRFSYQTFGGTSRILGEEFGFCIHLLPLFSIKKSIYFCHSSNYETVTYAILWLKSRETLCNFWARITLISSLKKKSLIQVCIKSYTWLWLCVEMCAHTHAPPKATDSLMSYERTLLLSGIMHISLVGTINTRGQANVVLHK